MTMDILIHAPDVAVDEELLRGLLTDGLKRFGEKLTRVDAFLRDENAQKGGVDKRCVLEARPRGLDPLSAEHRGETAREAFDGALKKLERVLEHRFGKLADRS